MRLRRMHIRARGWRALVQRVRRAALRHSTPAAAAGSAERHALAMAWAVAELDARRCRAPAGSKPAGQRQCWRLRQRLDLQWAAQPAPSDAFLRGEAAAAAKRAPQRSSWLRSSVARGGG